MELSALQKQAMNELLALERSYNKQIASQLKQTLIEMQGIMVEYYKKYAVDGKLSKSEMVQYGRLQSLEKQIIDVLNPTLKSTSNIIQKVPTNQYIEAYQYYSWAFDQTAGVTLNWGILNKKAIDATFSITNKNNIEYKNALKNYSLNGKKFIRNALINGLAQGKSLSKMATDLQMGIDKTFNEALRIVSTEGMTALHAGQNDAYSRAIQNGIEGHEEWLSTKDGKTRDTHRAIDGQKKGEDGNYRVPGPIGIELAPYPGYEGLTAANRINCRCDSVFIVDGFSVPIMRTREQGIIPYLPYKKWIKKYGPIIH